MPRVGAVGLASTLDPPYGPAKELPPPPPM
jgi:hypothetical protein